MLEKIYKSIFKLFILYLVVLNFLCFITTFNPKALINPFFIKNRTISVYLLLKHIIFESGIPVKIRDMEKINKTVNQVAEKYSVDPKLIHAIIKVESKYNPFAISRTGAMGLMQIMPITFFEMGFKDPFNIEENIEAGTKYLKIQLGYFKKLELALSAYNAGPGAITNNKIPEIFETKHYLKKILIEYTSLKSKETH
ncbi:lytic transglycosylase domain-containing protein [Deferribacter autotrophicus]|uniref:Lytic transglycosylase domain-containing protein n=1 Tax=Deferribacter autotrophicus TaxID=500465 RepID=A0A5A8F460_9BACT|nr:lytic transglycosylase domain-containing protein [Deferribacter autotrophicus]KAA0257330.1 lytic transglycosylase domain-containing protein [Deferribacter autotrophicus]